jgi:hypothetical protein
MLRICALTAEKNNTRKGIDHEKEINMDIGADLGCGNDRRWHGGVL